MHPLWGTHKDYMQTRTVLQEVDAKQEIDSLIHFCVTRNGCLRRRLALCNQCLLERRSCFA